jgi:hypothetical protein
MLLIANRICFNPLLHPAQAQRGVILQSRTFFLSLANKLYHETGPILSPRFACGNHAGMLGFLLS